MPPARAMQPRWAEKTIRLRLRPYPPCLRMSLVTTAPAAELVSIAGLELELLRRGAGNPLLLLHGFQHIDPRLPIVDLLARDVELIAPSHPGFGRSSRPVDFGTVYDLVHFYLAVLETLPPGPL